MFIEFRRNCGKIKVLPEVIGFCKSVCRLPHPRSREQPCQIRLKLIRACEPWLGIVSIPIERALSAPYCRIRIPGPGPSLRTGTRGPSGKKDTWSSNGLSSILIRRSSARVIDKLMSHAGHYRDLVNVSKYQRARIVEMKSTHFVNFTNTQSKKVFNPHLTWYFEICKNDNMRLVKVKFG